MDYQFQFGVLTNYIPVMLDGLLLTLLLSFVGIFGGLFIGLAFAIASISRSPALRLIIRIYVELLRNTPMLVQIFVIFFALPSLGIRLSPVISVFIAVVLNNSAYITEILRAGLQATHRSQFEAAESLGLSYVQMLRYVIIPPAVERVFAPVVSQSVLLMLSTSLVSAIGVEDLAGAAAVASSETFRTMEVYLIISVIYVGLSYVFRFVLGAAGLLVFTRSRRQLLGTA
uniref:amino acid ABC transporter permease n=1 Tax=Pararhizobium sp. IMCC3301 TaxID=3067904 RepID=UPI00274096C6|nr:amino acid ABC transporter permease [Pararhizobium sp. IMCC3301]